MPRYRSQELMTGGGGRGVIAATSAPSPAHVGQRWFNTATAVTYQYTRDAAGTKFWLDISSGGIGAVASSGVDFVGDISPHKATNSSGLAVGDIYYDRVKDRYFKCSDATGGANVWAGGYAAHGGTVTDYLDSGTYYRIHTFLVSGTFIVEDAMNVDYLVIGGGGGGGGVSSNTPGGGGGGAGAFRTATGFAVTAQAYPITVGFGGSGGGDITGAVSVDGSNSIFSSITALGGGRGAQYSTSNVAGAGGSGGGAALGRAAGAGGTYGNAGGTQSTQQAGGGGGGAGAVGSNTTTATGGAGGAGTANSYRTGSAVTYAGGGGGGGGYNSSSAAGGAGGAGGGGAGGAASGSTTGNDGTDATVNTGGGGGAGGGGTVSVNSQGGNGGSGIVVIRYAL